MKKFTLLSAGLLLAGVSVSAAEMMPGATLSALNQEKPDLSKVEAVRTNDFVKGNRAFAAASENGLITSAPGEREQYIADGNAWTNYMGILTMQLKFTILTDFYFDGDDVYIKNPISQYAANTFMKGTLEGDKITCKFPQVIYQEANSEGVLVDYYVSRLNGTEYENDWGSTSWRYEVPETDNEITYTLVDGKWVMEPSNYSVIIGLVDDEGYWYGFGDCDVIYQEFDKTPIDAPQGLETEEWALTADGQGHIVNVGFIDDEIYIQGISTYIPDAWVKGKVEGDNIVFEQAQYMGFYDSQAGSYLAFLLGAEKLTDSDYVILPEIVMSYDVANKVIKYDETLFVNSSIAFIRYLEMYEYPQIRWQPASFTPVPDHVTLTLYQGPEVYGYYAVRFILPNITPEGYILDTENLYWRLFLDDEVYEFDEEIYGEIPAGQTEVPYYYSGSYEIYGQGPEKTFFLYTEGFETFSIQALNKTSEKTYYSELLTYNVINNDTTLGPSVKVDKVVSGDFVNVEYFNINGQRISNPENGIFVKRSVMSDGSVKVEKVMIR